MSTFRPKWRDWTPEAAAKTPIQRTDNTDRRAFVSTVSASPKRFRENDGTGLGISSDYCEGISPETPIQRTDNTVKSPECVEIDLEERAAILEFDGEHSREDAERMARASLQPTPLVVTRTDNVARLRAYGVALEAWAIQHWQMPSADSCAACGAPRPSFELPDGAVVCRQQDWRCSIEYGQARKAAAANALSEAGITAPEGWE